MAIHYNPFKSKNKYDLHKFKDGTYNFKRNSNGTPTIAIPLSSLRGFLLKTKITKKILFVLESSNIFFMRSDQTYYKCFADTFYLSIRHRSIIVEHYVLVSTKE